MTSLDKIKGKLQKVVEKSILDYQDIKKEARDNFINSAYIVGGKGFCDRLKKYGRTEDGNPIKMPVWYQQLALIIGDLRIPHTLTTGSAQCGKTLIHSLFMVDCLASGKLNAGWFYPTKTALVQLVPMQFQPIANNYIQAMEEDGIEFKRNKDRTMTTRYQIEGATGVFSYVSTSRTNKTDVGIASASTAVVSYHIDLAFFEERSQWLPGSGDALPRRLDASVLPNKPIRELGTPGGGLGIEKEIEDANYHFYPHYHCPSCNETLPLDAKGCLLKKITRTNILGEKIEDYLSESGRPIEWFYKDESDTIKTAFIACSNCGAELSDKIRLEAEFYCIKTGISATDFIKSLDNRHHEDYLKVAMHLSPLTRDRKGQLLAEEIIRGGKDCLLTNDWQQQMLGHPSKNNAAHVTLDMLRLAIASKPPKREPLFRVCGIDTGRGEDWLTIMDFYLPEKYQELSLNEIIEQGIRNIIVAGDIMRDEIPSLLKQYKVKYGLIDNEPSRESSINLARSTCLELVNQVSNAQQILKQGIVADGGIEFNCWNVRNERFMQTVFNGFAFKGEDDKPLYRLPSNWNKWLGNPSERSPLIHLSAPYRDTENKWYRGKNNVDDLYMSFLFCEVSIYLLLNHQSSNHRIIAGNYYY